MYNKKGQFFLVAALVIAGILIGLAGVYTEVNAPKEDLSVYDLSAELNYESVQVIDQGVYTDLSDDQINEHITNLTNYYAEKNPTKDFAIVFGDQEAITVVSYVATDVGSVGISTGGTPQRNVVRTRVERSSTNGDDARVIGDNIAVRFKGQTYSFRVGAGTSFYSVLTSKAGNQQFVAADGSTKNSDSGSISSYMPCAGIAPRGSGVTKGDSTYRNTSAVNHTWNYVQRATLSLPDLKACQWTCIVGYTQKNSTACKNT